MTEAPPAPGVRETILGSGAGGPLTAPTPWLTFPGYIQYVSGGVVIGNPAGGNKGSGALNLQNLYINGTQFLPANFLPLTGGTLTGLLTLGVAPSGPWDAATKKYVDDSITTVNGNFANYLPLAGGTLTGNVTFSSGMLALFADPASPMQAATKQYVDTKFAGLIGIPDAPSDGTPYGRKNAVWVDVSRIDVGTY
jgi:hypothetical protein